MALELMTTAQLQQFIGSCHSMELKVLKDDDVAKMIQLAIEYAPAPPFNSGRPELAEEKTVAAVKQLFSAFAQQRREAIEQMTGAA